LLSLRGQQIGEIPSLPRRATELSVSPDGRMLAFSHGPYAGIWTIGVDGTNLRRVGRQKTTAPSWAPDGSTIASFGAGQIFTVGADGSDPWSFPACGEYWGSLIAHPKWSPDGETILCSWLSGIAGPSNLNVHVVTYNPDLDPVPGPDRLNQKPTILAGGDGVNAWDGDWSPDGTRIAFSRGETGRHFDIETADPRFDIWLMDADGSNDRPLVESDEEAEVGPFWSPDGTMIAYTSVGEARSVWVVDVASGGTRRVGPGTVFGWVNSTTLVVGRTL
jgi:Tol biopolymer transport system component